MSFIGQSPFEFRADRYVARKFRNETATTNAPAGYTGETAVISASGNQWLVDYSSTKSGLKRQIFNSLDTAKDFAQQYDPTGYWRMAGGSETPEDCVWGAWSEWSAWSECSNGERTRSRTREVTTPARNGGSCDGSATETETESCDGSGGNGNGGDGNGNGGNGNGGNGNGGNGGGGLGGNGGTEAEEIDKKWLILGGFAVLALAMMG